MFVYLPRIDHMLFAPTCAMIKNYLAQATDLAEIERRERTLEEERRRNLQLVR
jgi:hypothetical protein